MPKLRMVTLIDLYYLPTPGACKYPIQKIRRQKSQTGFRWRILFDDNG
ncbi:MAG: hypothetical protein SOH70_11400 [Lentilactobacillus sunkii]